MRTLRTLRRISGVSVVAVTAIALMAGCGDDNATPTGQQPTTGTTSAAVGTEHNQADITFAQGMIPHHQQAIEMAALATARGGSPDVQALAARIEAAQGPEIEEMTNWLTDWGVGLPSPAMPGHDMGGGMMTDEDMAALEAATGAAFDRMFLQMMTKHHEGAVQMAATEQQQGLNPGVKALAEMIEADQTAEIQQMRTLLGTA